MASVSIQLSKLWSSDTLVVLRQRSELHEKISTHQLIDFLGKLIECKTITDLGKEKIDLLEDIYHLKDTRNAEIRFRFLRLCIKAQLIERLDEILEFANSNFRMKFCRPIYRDLGQWPEARDTAIKSFNRVKSEMMTVCANGIAKDLGLK